MRRTLNFISRRVDPIFEANSFLAFSRRLYKSKSGDIGKPAIPRIQKIREGLKQTDSGIRPPQHSFAISHKGRALLDYLGVSKVNKKYSRGGENGEGYVGTEEIVDKLRNAAGSGEFVGNKNYDDLLERSEQIQNRMRVKVSESYLQHAIEISKGTNEVNPLLKVVMPDSREVDDLSGEIDPSNQNRYSPLPGLLHKYEMLLALVSINCSSHCRYCYRLDLFNGTSNKSKADMLVIAAYIKTFNEMIEEEISKHGQRDDETGLWFHKSTNEPLIPIREVLFSGGDPMTLPNATLARYMVLMAEAGISSIRVGTKEMVFNPSRFDEDFWKTMDMFHETYPDVGFEIVGHYSHPYELVESHIGPDGKYLYDLNLKYHLREDMKKPLHAAKERDWVKHSNQFPIITELNDDSKKIRLLAYLCHKFGIEMHNIYACREIIGNSHFRGDNDIPRQYKLVEDAKIGLSGRENHGRLVMSTEYGKVEVLGIVENEVLLKLNRYIHGIKPEHTIIKVDLAKLPEGERFYWLTEGVIEAAVNDEGKEALRELSEEDNSLIKKFKKTAAARVAGENPFAKSTANDNEEAHASKKVTTARIKNIRSKNVVTIRVESGKKGGFKDIEVDLSRFKEKAPTLATILEENGDVDATCKEQLSCSTCVGEVTSSGILPPESEDEKDLVDSVSDGIPSKSLRATCQIPLVTGNKYTFSGVASLKTKISPASHQQNKER